MAILPMAPPSEHQESMFAVESETTHETHPEIQPDTEFDLQVEAQFDGEAEGQFEDPAAFLDQNLDQNLDQDPYEADEILSVSDAPEDASSPQPIEMQAAEPIHHDEHHDPYAAAARKSEPEAAAEVHPEPKAEALPTLTSNDFSALEERVVRAVTLVRHERQARAAAEQRSADLELQIVELQANSTVIEALQQEVDTLRLEREQVRQRVERLLGQLDALEL